MGLQAFTAPSRHLAIGHRPCSDLNMRSVKLFLLTVNLVNSLLLNFSVIELILTLMKAAEIVRMALNLMKRWTRL